ncbi:MAG: hypothetical protein ACRYFZ_07245 [Janthinobacterium lividum]
MTDFGPLLAREIQRLHEDVVDTMEASDQRATGKTIRALRDESGAEYARLFGPAHARFLRDGRGPGGVNVSAIIEWVKAKRLKLNPYAVAEKISKEGTRLFRGEDPRFTKPTDTFAGPIASLLPRLREGLAEVARSGLRADLVSNLPSRL